MTSLPCFARLASCLINHQHTSRQRFSGRKACERRTVMSGIGTGVSARSIFCFSGLGEGSHPSMYSWYAVRSVSLYFLPGRKGVPDRLRAKSSRQQRVRSCFWPELLQVLPIAIWQSTQNAPCCLQDSHWFEMQGWRCSGIHGCSYLCEEKHAELYVRTQICVGCREDYHF